MLIRHISIQLLFFTFIFHSCKVETTNHRNIQVASYEIKKEVQSSIITGAERIGVFYPLLKDKKVALVVNHTSRVGESHLVDTLLNLKVNILKVFAPEHGFRGDRSDGEKVNDNIDTSTGLPIISLYGRKKKPTSEDLRDVDVVVFDIQDVGARFYTYISTMTYVMDACAENNIPFIVLDRPNPHTDYIDGPILQEGYETFVGLHPVPVVYGMTIGEYARMTNGENWLESGKKCDLSVIELKNYKRGDFYKFPVAPSPNLPNMLSVLLYPSICFFEGTEVSVGRGTEKQFQVLGHPLLKDMDFQFTPLPNRGSKYPPQEGKKCYGIDLGQETIGSWMNKNQLDLSYLLEFYKKLSTEGNAFFLETSHFDRLAGTGALKKQIMNGLGLHDIRKSWEDDLKEFEIIRQKYLIYPL